MHLPRIDVAQVARSAERLAAVENAVTKTGVKAKTYVVDLANLSQVQERMHQIVLDLSNIEILINNAGIDYTATHARNIFIRLAASNRFELYKRI